MKGTTTVWLTVLLAVLLLIPAAASADTAIMVATDLHYLSPSLYEGSELFLRALRQGDSKVTHHSGELLQALVDETLARRPDVLLLTGDLTYNGEKKSHEEFAAAMDTLWEAGIPVYVIPGNHDINNPRSYRYDGETYAATDNVTPEEFARIWRRCMLPAESEDRMSYCVRLNDRVWLAMLDVSVYEEAVETYGFYSEELQAWLQPLMAEAAAAGVTVISATHQSLVPQSSYRPGSYGIYNREYLQADLRAGGVTLNLSGHIHVQHLARENGITDAATGALSVSPHCFGWITVPDGGEPRYERFFLSADYLPEGFREESAAWFDANTERQNQGVLTGVEASPEDRERMLRFVLRFNAAYFGGSIDPDAMRADPDFILWESLAPESGFVGRVRSTLEAEERFMAGDEP